MPVKVGNIIDVGRTKENGKEKGGVVWRDLGRNGEQFCGKNVSHMSLYNVPGYKESGNVL